MPAPLSPEKREHVAALIREGKTRNAIARETGVSGATVTKIAKDLENGSGVPAFDRSATKHATAAREADQAAERVRLRQLLLADAHKLREQLWKPCEVFNFGGKDNTLNSKQLDQPTFEQQAKIMTSVGICVDKIVRLDAANDGAEREAASLVKGLVDEIRAKRATPVDAEPDRASQ